ncbi:unnamed protein product [Microthlaspi erraticum]|uniref:Uncharacterized protein n=1 Tax=Microthlaspi erraticum TaxID=1685480 RepID=A0A6D2KSU8_9BRAS|nr:unnamed protein product [Microthlaspi erraticum]
MKIINEIYGAPIFDVYHDDDEVQWRIYMYEFPSPPPGTSLFRTGPGNLLAHECYRVLELSLYNGDRKEKSTRKKKLQLPSSRDITDITTSVRWANHKPIRPTYNTLTLTWLYT